MKILDRYVLATFIKNYLISFLVLIGLYVALDMVFNFDNLVDPSKSPSAGSLSVVQIIADIGAYYAYQAPLIFVHLSGMIAVVGAAFTLMRLSRFNELTAILAAGTSLLRVALPIVVAGIALNALLLADQELVIPQIIPKLIRSHDEMHSQTVKTFMVQMMQDDHNGLLCAARYTPPSEGKAALIEYLDVVERDDHLNPRGHLTADAAEWDDGSRVWRLTKGKHVTVLRADEQARPEPEHDVQTYRSDITPEEISLWRGGDYVQLLPTSRINQLLNRPKSYGQNNLLRTKNMRFTQPLVNVILLLLAIPAVLTREPGKLKTAALRCLVLCGLCMGTVFLSFQLAASPLNRDWAQQWPALMAWMPVFLFGPLSVWLLDRVKT